MFGNAEVLETLAKVDTLVVDKTGTLTEGKPQVVRVSCLSGARAFPKTICLGLAASIESASEHPLARAIVRAAEERRIDLSPGLRLSRHARRRRHGEACSSRKNTVWIGALKFLEARGVHASAAANECVRRTKVKPPLYVFVGNEQKIVGVLALADRIKSSASSAIN